MKTINLLPKKTFWEAWFIPLLAAIAVVCILAFIGLTSGTLLLQNQHKKQLAEIENLTAAIRDATDLRKPDPLSIEFDRYKQLVTGLESTKFDWVSVMDTVTRMMPEVSRLRSALYDPQKKQVEATLDVRSLADAAKYVGALRGAEGLGEVLVTDLSKTSFTAFSASAGETSGAFEQMVGDAMPQISGSAFSAEAANAVTSPDTASGTGVNAAQDLLEQAGAAQDESELAAAEQDETERLLEELNSLILGQGAGLPEPQEETVPVTPQAPGEPGQPADTEAPAAAETTYYTLTLVLKVQKDKPGMEAAAGP